MNNPMRLLKVGSVTALLLFAGFAVGWYWSSHSDDEAVRAVEDANAALRDTLAVRDSIRAALDDSMLILRREAATADSAARAARSAWLATKQRAGRTGETLEDHLRARQDSRGLALLDQHQQADRDREFSAANAILHQGRQIAALQNQVSVQALIIAAQDSSIMGLVRRLNATQSELTAEVERLNKRLNPPFAVRLLRDGWKVAVGVAGGYALGSL